MCHSICSSSTARRFHAAGSRARSIRRSRFGDFGHLSPTLIPLSVTIGVGSSLHLC